MILLVLSMAHFKKENGYLHGIPYALTLVPAEKRGAVDHRDIDQIAQFDVQKFLNEAEPCYSGLDPFTGDKATPRRLYASASGYSHDHDPKRTFAGRS
jgi:hypothetical protein